MIIVSNRPLKLRQCENISHVVEPSQQSTISLFSLCDDFIYGTRFNVIMSPRKKEFTKNEAIKYVSKICYRYIHAHMFVGAFYTFPDTFNCTIIHN